jgi:hypothetical protein
MTCPVCDSPTYYAAGYYCCEECSWRVKADECGPDTLREKRGEA